VLAEQAVTWYHAPGPQHFTDLVDLEMQIAEISTMILLIVESPGSMAELGAFTYVDRILKKLQVVMERRYQNKQSFIMDGPVAKIRAQKPDEAGAEKFYSCDWLSPESDNEIDAELSQRAATGIIQDLLDPALQGQPAPEPFDLQNAGHKMLLIADFVSLGGSLRFQEIMELLGGLPVKTSETEVKGFLLLLERLGFLRKTHLRRYDYYVQTNSKLRFILYAMADETRSDRERLRADIKYALSDKAKPTDR